MNENFNGTFIYNTVKILYHYNNRKKKYITCKIFYLVVYIFALWESDAEHPLLMLLVKMSRDFVRHSSSGRSFHRKAPLQLKLHVHVLFR